MQKNIFPTIQMEPVSLSSQLMTVRVFIKKGTVIAEHTHANDQTSYLEAGSLRYTIAGQVVVLDKGQGIAIAAGVPHGCTALEDTTDINTFFPPREDYRHLFKEDSK